MLKKVCKNQEQLRTAKCIIYSITNTINGKRYIGQTIRRFNDRYDGIGVGVERVKSKYEKDGGNTHLYNSICKYGVENFSVEILHMGKTKDELNYFEDFYIKYYNTRNPKHGYNIKPGGDSCSGYHMPVEYYLFNIKRDYGEKKAKAVEKFISKRIKDGVYDGEECYILYSAKIKYEEKTYKGLLNIPQKIAKTSSIKKLYELDYDIVEKDINKPKTKKQILHEQGNEIYDWICNLYEQYYDIYEKDITVNDYGMFEEIEMKSISKEKYETIVKPIVIDYIKDNYKEFYEEYSEKGEKWMITRIENKWY